MTSRPLNLALRSNILLRRFVYRSSTATRAVTGLRLQPARSTSYFELGTLAVAWALRDSLRDGMRVADVGAGPYAIVSLWALRRWQLDLVATEVHDPWVQHARRMASTNDLELDIRCCDLLSEVEGPLDLTWFVPPFMPETAFEQGFALDGSIDPELELETKLRSCGGKEGWELVDRWLLQARERLAPTGRALTVVNEAHLSSDKLVALGRERGFGTPTIRSLPGIPYIVLDFGLA